MKNKELKKMFYIWCKSITYTPSIFEDEIWDYLMNSVGQYIGSTKIWEQFCYIANTVYEGDLDKMRDDAFKITNDLTTLINTGIETNFSDEKFPIVEHYEKFSSIPNGAYIAFDMKNAMFQSLMYYNIITEDEYNSVYSKYSYGEDLKKCKWITYYVFLRSVLLHKNQTKHSFVKQLILDTINSGDPLLTELINKNGTYYICGDRLYIPIHEKDIDVYNNILYKEYTSTNGAVFFVDVCRKKVLRHGDITVITNNNVKSNNAFYDEIRQDYLSYDFYPQAYKKLIKQPLEQYDTVYGYDDDICFFDKTIWK